MVENISFQYYFLSLFAVANNFSALGMFVSLCSGLAVKEQRKLALIATFAAFATMIITLLGGKAVLDFFNISIDAFRIAGGMLLCVSGLGMLNSKPQDTTDHESIKKSLSSVISIAIVPVGLPLTTGGGTISTIILLSDSLTNWAITAKLLSAIVLISIIDYFVFRYAAVLSHYLGNVGMDVIIKVMGLITLAIGVQFIINGLSVVFPVLKAVL